MKGTSQGGLELSKISLIWAWRLSSQRKKWKFSDSYFPHFVGRCIKTQFKSLMLSTAIFMLIHFNAIVVAVGVSGAVEMRYFLFLFASFTQAIFCRCKYSDLESLSYCWLVARCRLRKCTGLYNRPYASLAM